jgi:hypothetical protein
LQKKAWVIEKKKERKKKNKCPNEMKKWKKKSAAQVLPKFPSFIERYVFSRSKSRIRFSPTPHIYIPHTCTSWFDCMTHFSRSIVWLYNICFASMYALSPHL